MDLIQYKWRKSMKKKILIGLGIGIIVIVFVLMSLLFFKKQTTEEYSSEPMLPSGFKKVDTPEATWEKTGDLVIDRDKGLVIEDTTNGNQFVWVPVDKEVTHKSLETPNHMPLTLTDKEKKQIKKYGGFYIGRYEAGVSEELTEIMTEIGEKTNDVEGIPVSRQGVKPWNFISYDQAKSNTEKMYTGSGVESGIMSEAYWMLMLEWLSNADYDVYNNSGEFGNYSDRQFVFTGLYSEDYGKNYQFGEEKLKAEKNLILSTGSTERNKSCNIYDLAGNLREFVNSERGSSTYGGYYDNIASPLTWQQSDFGANDQCGFRVVLYITE